MSNLKWLAIIADRDAGRMKGPDTRLYNTRTEMNALFQLLSDSDIELLLPLMREFYTNQQMTYAETVATDSLKKLVNNSRLGHAYLIFWGAELAGYFVLTFCFSMEFHGRFGLLDELYIREPFRRNKLGRSVVEFAQRICRAQHVAALRLEVGLSNAPAQSLYRAEGFQVDQRHLMTKWL
jgi:ribosomal protein S18 acetylase RimI-like enzyme